MTPASVCAVKDGYRGKLNQQAVAENLRIKAKSVCAVTEMSGEKLDYCLQPVVESLAMIASFLSAVQER